MNVLELLIKLGKFEPSPQAKHDARVDARKEGTARARLARQNNKKRGKRG